VRTIPQNLIRDKIYCVNYIEYIGESDARKYFYIAVRQDEMVEFKEALKHGDFDADDFGIILEQGDGSAPEYVKDKMKMLYKCNHENAMDVKDYSFKEDQ
jgi:hypothetical protein